MVTKKKCAHKKQSLLFDPVAPMFTYNRKKHSVSKRGIVGDRKKNGVMDKTENAI